MASAGSPTVEELKQSIEKDGFFYQADSVIGTRVDEFAKKGYPFKTEDGLDFCKINALDDKRIRETLESFFAWSGLGLYKAFGHDSQHAFSFLGNEKSQVQALVVQLWSTGSKVIFYKHSHLLSMDPTPAANGLLEISAEKLAVDSVKRSEVEMKEGGLSMLDARLGFTIVQGVAITFAFAVEVELKEWAKMKLPNSSNLEDKVATMISDNIGMNFEFQDDTQGIHPAVKT